MQAEVTFGTSGSSPVAKNVHCPLNLISSCWANGQIGFPVTLLQLQLAMGLGSSQWNTVKIHVLLPGQVTTWRSVPSLFPNSGWIEDPEEKAECAGDACVRAQSLSHHYFADKCPSSQGYGFSSSHVWMWELDYKESWVLKNWCFWTVVLEKTLESPLDCKGIQSV